MKNLPAVPLFLVVFFLGFPSLAFGQEADDFKVAGVNIQRVFQEFYKTTKTEQDINEERIRIQKTDRQLRSQLSKVDKQLAKESQKAKDDTLSDEEKEAHTAKIERMVAERNKLNQDRASRYEANNSQLNQDMMSTMSGLLGEIQRFVEAHAEENGYDVVFDLSGTSTNQMVPVIGGKGLLDITETVIAELNKVQPKVDPKQ